MKTIQEAIEKIENEADDSCVGPQRAFFQLAGHRYIYRSYGFIADTYEEALSALVYVLQHEIRAPQDGTPGYDVPDGSVREHDAFLFWRMREKIQVEPMLGRYRARTRLVVVKHDGEK